MSENKIELSGIFSEGYGVIPKRLMKANIDKNIKLILCYMLSYTGAGNTCFPSIRTIAKDLQMSSSTIVKYIKKAVEYGYIEKSKLMPNNPLNHANKYKMLFFDVSLYKNIDVSLDKTPCIDDNNSECQQLIQNNNSINNNSSNINDASASDAYKEIENTYFETYKQLYNKEPLYDYNSNRGLLKKRLKQVSKDDIIKAINKAKDDKWIIDKGLFNLKTILKEENINKYLAVNNNIPKPLNGTEWASGVNYVE